MTTKLKNRYLLMGAEFSGCGLYRYRLSRTWDFQKPPALFCALHPGHAGAETDDATVRRCVTLADTWGHGGVELVSLFAYKCTDPEILERLPARNVDPVGPLNDREIEILVKTVVMTTRSDRLARFVACWGSLGPYTARGEAVYSLMRQYGQVSHLGVTRDGDPQDVRKVRVGKEPVEFEL